MPNTVLFKQHLLGFTGRNLYQFAMMIDCATNRSAWDYYDYGCWCGYGESGTPVDETDRYSIIRRYANSARLCTRFLVNNGNMCI